MCLDIYVSLIIYISFCNLFYKLNLANKKALLKSLYSLSRFPSHSFCPTKYQWVVILCEPPDHPNIILFTRYYGHFFLITLQQISKYSYSGEQYPIVEHACYCLLGIPLSCIRISIIFSINVSHSSRMLYHCHFLQWNYHICLSSHAVLFDDATLIVLPPLFSCCFFYFCCSIFLIFKSEGSIGF